jgi:hypothetical protein
MIQGLSSTPGGVDKDLEVFFDFGLPLKVIESAGAEQVLPLVSVVMILSR